MEGYVGQQFGKLIIISNPFVVTKHNHTIIRERIFKLGWPIEKALTITNGAKRGEWKNE